MPTFSKEGCHELAPTNASFWMDVGWMGIFFIG
jgi:hypothetical protein